MRLFEGTPFDIPPTCDRCGWPEQECTCPPQARPSVPPEKQTARLAVEKRKRGREVTVVRGLIDDAGLFVLLAQLQSACGAGGTVKAGAVELQGNHLERVEAILRSSGYRVQH